MNLYVVLSLYVVVFVITVMVFRKYLGKSIFAAFLAGLILGQFVLIFLSCFGLFQSTDNGSTPMSTDMIFWSINLITPFLVYGSLLFMIYTKDL